MIPVDYSLMGQKRPPITDLGAPPKGDWCGYCGYTGHVAGPVQQSCPERHGWHSWLRQCVDLHSPWPTREDREAAS